MTWRANGPLPRNEQQRLDPAAATQRHERNQVRRGRRQDADQPGTGEIVGRATVVPQQSVRPAHGGRDAPYQPAAVGAKQDVEVIGEELSVGGRRHGRRTRVVADVQFDVVVAGPQLEARPRLARLHRVAARQAERDRRAQPGHRTAGSQRTTTRDWTVGRGRQRCSSSRAGPLACGGHGWARPPHAT